MFKLDNLIRENIKKLVPYSSARDEFKGEAKIYLDANENSLGSPLPRWYNRYPDPHQWAVKEKLSDIKQVPAEKIFLGNGSDECIDILYRAFCMPGQDNVIICPPTYGMYEVSANINDIKVKKVNLLPDFQLDLDSIEEAIDDFTKIIWLCSPNNPTGNCLEREDIEIILNNFNGIVVIDEAYINFARHRSFLQDLDEYPNLVVLQTLSKAWGLAGLRLGMAFASEEIIRIYDRVKPPYNISQVTQDLVLKALDELEQVNDMIILLVEERKKLSEQLLEISWIKKVYPSDANFLLLQMPNARKLYEYLRGRGIVLRDRSNVVLCDDCIRVTVGTPAENLELVKELNDIPAEFLHL
jgi:histidinol-phosphate aminotransferase